MLHTLVTENIPNYQRHTSVIYDPGDGDTDTLYKISYSLMGQQISEIASVFNSVCTKGQVIGILLADCAEIPSIYLGLLTASCAFYPINIDGIHYTINALKRMAVSFIVAHAQFSEKLQFLVKQLDGHEIKSEVMLKFGLQLYGLQHGSSMPVSSNMCHDLAYCITTSGTTNKPKIVRVPHSCIVPNILHLRKIFQLGPGDKMLLTAPLTFDPSIIDIFCTLSSGACLVIVPTKVKCKPDKLLSILHERQAITALQATPSLMKSFSPSRLQQTILGPQTALKVLALGGEKFPVTDVRSWLHKDNVTTQLYNLYGITEVSCWATCHPVDVEYLCASEATVPIGTVLDKTEVKIVPFESDEENSDEGSIWIGSRERICIIDDEAVKSQKLQEGDPGRIVWRNSGDMGRLLPGGNIVCLGRMDDQVKRHGKRLNLGAIELACKELPEVSDCCALLNENVLMAFVTLNNVQASNIKLSEEQTSGDLQEMPSCSTHDFRHSLHIGDFHREHDQVRLRKRELEIKLKDDVQETLPRHCIPDTFVIIDGSFPLTSHGKLNKKQLLKIRTEAVGKNPRVEATGLTEFVRQLWQNHLPESAMTIESTDNFISLGGDSLAAVQLINEVENMFGNSWPSLLDLLVNKTFSTFAAELTKYVDVKKLQETQMTSLQRISSSTVLTGNSIAEISSQSERSKTNERLLETALLANTTSPADQAISPHVKHKIHSDGYTDFPPKYRKTDVEFSSSTTVTQRREVMSLPIHHFNPQSESEVEVSDEKLSVRFKPRKVISRGNLCQRKVDEKRDSEDHSGHDIDCVCTACEKNSFYEPETNSTSVPCEISGDAKLFLEVKWKFDTKKCVDASPLVLEYETVICAFIGSHSGQFSAIDVQHGTLLWSVTLPDRIESSACSTLCGQSVVVGCYDGCVYFLNSMTGSVVWRFVTQDVVKCSPVVDESSGNIIIGSHDGALYCLNVQMKQCIWKSYLGGGSVFASPIVDVSKHVVYAASLSGKVTALCVNSGTEMWTVDLGKPIFSSLCLLEDSVLVGCVDQNLYRLTSKGQIRWTFRTQAPIFSSPTVWDSTVVIGSHDKHIYCLSQTGKLLWKFRTTNNVYTTAYMAWLSNAGQCCENTASDFAADKLSHLIDSESSSEISKRTSQIGTNVTTEVSSSVIDSNPTKIFNRTCQTLRVDTSQSETSVSSVCSKQYLKVLVSASTDGNLYLLDHESGRPLTQVKLPGEVFSSPVIVDRTVVVGCRDNFVYCFEIT